MKTLFRLLMIFLLTAQVALAQRTISGVVSDSDGIPLPGATVLIQGTTPEIVLCAKATWAVSKKIISNLNKVFINLSLVNNN